MCPGVSGGTPYLLPALWAHGPLQAYGFLAPLGPPWVALDALLALLGSWDAFLADFLPTENSSKIRLLKKPPKIEKIRPWTPKCRFFNDFWSHFGIIFLSNFHAFSQKAESTVFLLKPIENQHFRLSKASFFRSNFDQNFKLFLGPLLGRHFCDFWHTLTPTYIEIIPQPPP